MLKDFLKELFGLVFFGLGFERVFWLVLAVAGMFVAFRTWQSYQKYGSETPDLPFRVVMGVGLTGAGLFYGSQAWLSSGYKLFFAEPLVLHTYGVCIAMGFVFAIWIAVIEAQRTGLDGTRVLDLSFWVLIAGMLGSRAVFMMVEWRAYVERCTDPAAQGLTAPDCFAVLRFWEGGLVFYGGLIGAILAGVTYLHRNKLEVWRYADVMVVGVPVGQFFGRMGCLAAGCCHGKYVPSERMMGLHWPEGTAAYGVILRGLEEGADKALFQAEHFVSAHPTQLYSSGAALLIFVALMLLRTRKRFNGQIIIAYMMMYAVARGVIEIFRGDKIRGFIVEYRNESISGFLGLPLGEPLLLSTSQFISLLMLTAGVVLWVVLSRQRQGEPVGRKDG